ncbi:acetolactate synthase small subunit [Aestuariispira insulae]|uniref:Acetolactate synthase small subunit n=1 Tax=Aestuariispira insulae TaxID=1461337 RepID=A0A3D9HXG7_9PROT|nr:acetolactate synthase small subunit [Aestuariispira insulae]RED54198.1 acetolactate synthase small subunit [Aestuariispira insulae]
MAISGPSEKNAKQPGAAYEFISNTEDKRRHTFAVIVDNEPGVLARVIGLFSGRGYNIESLTVSTVTEDESTSRINIVTIGTAMVIEQIKAQLERLVPVHNVHDLTIEGPHVEKELALVKVKATDHQRRESLRIADIYKARVADTTLESFVFLIDGEAEKVDSFIEMMRALGEVEVARSGVVAISRGSTITPV